MNFRLTRLNRVGWLTVLSLLMNGQIAIAASPHTNWANLEQPHPNRLILAQTESSDSSDTAAPETSDAETPDSDDAAAGSDSYQIFDSEGFNLDSTVAPDDVDPALDEDAVEDAELGDAEDTEDSSTYEVDDSDDDDSDDDSDDTDDAATDAEEEPDRFAIRAEFFRDPLQDSPLDPLVPATVTSRPLNAEEQTELRDNLNQLHAQGVAVYEAGELEDALPIWRRELRLWRLLAPIEEVQALDRVGLIVWDENQTTDVNIITERLQQIRTAELDPEASIDATIPVDFELLQAVGEAFGTVRSYDDAVVSYEQIAFESRRRNQDNLQESALNTLAEIHLAWFKYPAAAAVYQELMAFAQNRNDAARELDYLELLAKTYDRGDIYQQAITTQEQLAENFQIKSPEDVAALKIAIAANHEALGQYQQAAQAYQEAFTVAQAQQQYGLASDALNALGEMYLGLDRPDDALYVYQLLVDVDNQSYNRYGQMETYDNIGRIHLLQRNYPQALSAFRLGFAIAEQISYREGYFSRRIESIANPPKPGKLPVR